MKEIIRKKYNEKLRKMSRTLFNMRNDVRASNAHGMPALIEHMVMLNIRKAIFGCVW